MASILTITSAMVALKNIRPINSNLVETQNQIAAAKGNFAIWSVSKFLGSDRTAFLAERKNREWTCS